MTTKKTTTRKPRTSKTKTVKTEVIKDPTPQLPATRQPVQVDVEIGQDPETPTIIRGSVNFQVDVAALVFEVANLFFGRRR